MNAALKPIIKNIRQLSLSDQLELISELTRSLSRSYPERRESTATAPLNHHDWFEKIIHLNPTEISTETLTRRIEQERASWD
jgi:hypothetical protein